MLFGMFQKQIKKENPRTQQTKVPSVSPSKIESDVEITPEFSNVLKSIDDGKSFIFITGMAGSGKSTLIDLIKNRLKLSHLLVAPTGIAALNIGGSTIHSIFRVPFGPCPETKKIDGMGGIILRNLELLIIDEISMVRADVLDAISNSLQIHKKNKKPFGGIQVAVFGDLFQLPPVLNDDDKQILFSKYTSEYFFSAKCLENIEPTVVTLSKVFRQKDSTFQSLLSSIRMGTDVENAIKYINEKCVSVDPEIKAKLTLTTRTEQANEINSGELSILPGDDHSYPARINGQYFSDKQDKALPAPTELILKVGARVLFVKNNKNFWVNGDLGTVKNLFNDKITVELDRGGVQDVYQESWHHYRYFMDQETEQIEKEIVASFSQFPLRLGWAVTIHKSQGLTLESCTIDTGPNGAFLHGQVYVALSRCKTLDALKLKRPITSADVILDPMITEFQKAYSEVV